MRIARKQRGFTVIEMSIVMALGTLVFGMVLAALTETSRASDEVVASQQMRQEALLIAQSVERIVRYRVDAGELALAGIEELQVPPGEATVVAQRTTAPQAAASTVPLSLVDNFPTTSAAVQMPAPSARTPTAAELTSVPATIRSILTTTTTAQQKRPPAGKEERFTSSELTVYSLSGGHEPSRLLTTIRNSRGLPNEPRHAYIDRNEPGDANEEARGSTERLGGSSDRLQSSIAFRYGTEYIGTDAQWQRRSGEVPRVIEYTVYVWPTTAGVDFASAKDSQGRAAGFKYTSAVSVR